MSRRCCGASRTRSPPRRPTARCCSRTTPQWRCSASRRARSCSRALPSRSGRASSRSARTAPPSRRTSSPGAARSRGEEAPEAVIRFRVGATGAERWSKVKASPVRDAEGGVTMAINVIEDITDSKRTELAQRFLSRASDALAARLDVDTVLERIAVLAIPEMAEWCAVDLVGEDDELERVALTHADPQRRQRAIELAERYPPDPASDRGAYEVLRTGRPMLYPARARRAAARGRARRAPLRALEGVRDPLRARGSDERARPGAGGAHLCQRRGGSPLRRGRPRRGGGARTPLCDGDRERPPVQRARLHRPNPPAEPAARGAARRPGDRGGRPLPPGG